MEKFNLEKTLLKCKKSEEISEEEMVFLLGLKDKENRKKLYKAAREVRNESFGNKIFTYGFVYFSTYCKNNCTFCNYRKSNDLSERYRKTVEEILATANKLKQEGVNLIDLTMGEDPVYYKDNQQKLIDLVKLVKEETNMPVMVSPGVIPNEAIDKLADMGAEWYACYQETHNVEKYNKMRLEQDYNVRMNAKEYAKKSGMLIEEGLLVGGMDISLEDIAHSFTEMKRIEADQVRVMTFVPQEGTPLQNEKASDNVLELNTIAVMRLLFHDQLIPASLDVEGLKGLEARLNAGASVVTSIIPPHDGFRGVSQSTLDVDSAHRTVSGIQPVIKKCGLSLATVEEYKNWIHKRLYNMKEVI